MAYKHTTLAKLIRKKMGIDLLEFCEKHLKSEYKAFQIRMRKRKYYPAEVVYICWVLGVRIHDIFGYSFQELIMFQGKYEVPERVREMWSTADGEEKRRLLALVGLAEGSIAPKVVKIIPKIRAPKVKADPIQKDNSNPLDFFMELEPTKREEVPVVPKAAPKDDPLQGFFIDTY